MSDPQDKLARAAADEGFESQLDAIRIKLESFEGPLDLLVHLIRKNRMNVRDIPIHTITAQYLEYLDLMEELNLDVAGEFIVMAATLIHIKSRMLLPRPDPTQDDADALEDPRDALVRRLLEHQKFKAAAELLHDRETLRSAQWMRPDASVEAIAGDDYEPELEVDLFSLLSAFRAVLERARERPPMALPPEQVSIEARIEQLLERLSETDACGFQDLFDDTATRGDMIVTFLALLEMIRLKLIRVFQSAQLGAIRVYKRARPQDAPHPIHDPEDSYKEHHPAHPPAPANADAPATPDVRSGEAPAPPEADSASPEASPASAEGAPAAPEAKTATDHEDEEPEESR
jgi:segregation and condensation protein A